MEGEIITMSELFRFERQGVDEDGMIMGGLQADRHRSGFPQDAWFTRYRSAD